MTWLRLVGGGIALLGLLGAAPALPQYSLPVGRQLVYSGHSSFKYDGGSFDSLASLELTVLAVNADGSCRILVRAGTSNVQNRSGAPATQPTEASERVSYTRVDMFPDGRVVSVVGGFDHSPPAVLPPLPVDQKEMGATWQREPAIPGSTEVFRSADPATGGQWVLVSSSEGIFKAIYGIASQATYHFDANRGIVTSIDEHNQQTYGFHGSGDGNTHMDSDQALPPAQLDALKNDAATVMDAEAQMRTQMQRIDSAPRDATQIAGQVKASLAAAAAKVTIPELKAQVQRDADDIDEEAQYAARSAQRIAAITNTPAFAFSTTDVDGAPHKLGDYHGKVLVLDFWYRGCGWCMRAMPQMKQVVDDFKGKPVVVLGMNTDQDIADARFVIDAMKLNYQTLKIDFPVANKFNVQGFPSLLVIDGNGIVRHFDEGYSPTLRTDLDKTIQMVLDAPVAPTTAPVQ